MSKPIDFDVECYNETISIIWSWEDVYENHPHLTKEQCCDVLYHLKECHDANIGINWDVIAWAAHYCFGDSSESEEI